MSLQDPPAPSEVGAVIFGWERGAWGTWPGWGRAHGAVGTLRGHPVAPRLISGCRGGEAGGGSRGFPLIKWLLISRRLEPSARCRLPLPASWHAAATQPCRGERARAPACRGAAALRALRQRGPGREPPGPRPGSIAAGAALAVSAGGWQAGALTGRERSPRAGLCAEALWCPVLCAAGLEQAGGGVPLAGTRVPAARHGTGGSRRCVAGCWGPAAWLPPAHPALPVHHPHHGHPALRERAGPREWGRAGERASAAARRALNSSVHLATAIPSLK